MRGPSGRPGCESARRKKKARAGVLDSTLSGRQASRNEVMAVIPACFDRRVVRNAGYEAAPERRRRRFKVLMNHETRDTAFGIAVGAQGSRHRKPPSWTTAPAAKSLLSRCAIVARHGSAITGDRRHTGAVRSHPRAARRRSRWRGFAGRAMARHGRHIARHAGGEWGVSKCPCTVSRSQSASRRAPLAADPVALRAASAAADAK